MFEEVKEIELKYLVDALFATSGLAYNKFTVRDSSILIEIMPEIPIELDIDPLYRILRRITRKEEKIKRLRDKHNRFVSQFSDENFKKPEFDIFVNKIVNLAFNRAKELGVPLIQKWFWPENKKFAICLTHDIDKLKPSIRYDLATLKALIKRKKASLLFKKIIDTIKRKNPWDPLRIVEIEKRYNASSTFFFLVSGKSKFDNYTKNEKYLSKVIKRLKMEKHEVGLHSSYSSFGNLSDLIKEKKYLENFLDDKVKGIRQHYLLLNAFETLEVFEKADFLYDSTFGYADNIGFRGGISFPFHPYIMEKQSILQILEIPLIVMDTTFSAYLNIDANDAEKSIFELLNITMKNNALITILWHNNSFDEYLNSSWLKIYERILKFGAENNAWLTNAYNIFNWWIRREKTKIQYLENNDNKKIAKINGFKGLYTKVFLPDGWKLRMNEHEIKKSGILNIPTFKKYSFVFERI